MYKFFSPYSKGREGLHINFFAQSVFDTVRYKTLASVSPYWQWLILGSSIPQLITEVKQHWAWLVLGWVTAWEHHVPLAFHLGREADHSPPSSAEVKEWVLYLHSPTTPS